jgi:hypothetical protein
MFPTTKTITLSNGSDVECYDLTVAMIDAIDQDSDKDTLINVIADATDLSKDEVKNLRRNDAVKLYEAIIKLTYPELYDKKNEQTGDKKKA